MHILFILHESFESPGYYLNWAEDRGHETSIIHVYNEEKLPENIEAYDMLIVMGGPQSPKEDVEKYPFYHPKEEIKLIQKFIDADKFIVGSCLGAQLMGEAYGATFSHSPEIEIGNILLEMTEDGKKDEKLTKFTTGMEVGSWHGDMPGLSDKAVILAKSQGCPRQIIRYSYKHYGFQCHPEFTKEAVEALINSERDLELLAKEHSYVKEIADLKKDEYDQMNRALAYFLDQLVN